MISIIQTVRPLQQNKMEIFGEIIVLLALYILMCFSDFISSLETRHYLGFAYIGVFSVYAMVHIISLLVSTCKKVIAKIKLKFNLCRT